MRQLQDRYETYCEIKTTSRFSGTSIHSILHKHLTDIVRIGSHTICQSLKNSLVSIGQNKCSKNTIAVSFETRLCIVTGYQSWIYAYEPEIRQQSTVLVFQAEPNPTKVARIRSTSRQMIPCFLWKNWKCRNCTTHRQLHF